MYTLPLQMRTNIELYQFSYVLYIMLETYTQVDCGKHENTIRKQLQIYQEIVSLMSC